MADELIAEGLRRAAEEGDKQRQAEKERDEKTSTERKTKLAETAKRNAADTYRTQISQQAFDFGGPEKDTASQEKAKEKKAADDYFKDNRTKSSPLIVNAEIAKMKKSNQQMSMISPGGNTTAAGRGELKGASGSAGSNELLKAINKPYKAGGKVSSASSRADGCATKGKTKCRYI